MSEPSGPHWVALFPTSASPNDLIPGFRDRVQAFISALKNGGASVRISATLRPRERAYLMHWAWGIARGFPPNMCDPGQKPNVPIDPALAKLDPAIDIDWTHGGNTSAARAAAQAMVAGYGMKDCAALNSNHIRGEAIDMTIGWKGTLSIHDFDGVSHAIDSQPRDGTNAELAKVGASFKVFKLIGRDPPHWSIDGH